MRSKNKYNSILFISLLLIFSTISFAEIMNVEVTPLYNSVRFNWTSDESNAGIVHYGVGSLTDSQPENAVTKNHSVLLTGLLPETTYTYRVQSGYEYYPSQTTTLNFTTQPFGSVVPLSESNLIYPPAASAESRIIVEGESDKKIRIKRNFGEYWYEQKLYLEDGSSVFYYDSDGDFSLGLNLVEGDNDFRIEFIDPFSNEVERMDFSIFGDFTPPAFEFASLPSYSQGTIRLIGVMEINASVKVYSNGNTLNTFRSIEFFDNVSDRYSDLGFETEGMGYVNNSLTLSGDGEQNLTFVVSDLLGNNISFDAKVYVDRMEPQITNITIVSISEMVISGGSTGYRGGLWTPFNPVTLQGIAEDNSGNDDLTVYVINLRNETGNKCDRYADDIEQSFLEGYEYGFNPNNNGAFDLEASFSMNLVGAILGNSGSKITPDNDGEFESIVSLMSPNRLINETDRDNNICILAIDKAGNVDNAFKVITYEPTSTVWGVSGFQSEPTELYTAWIKHQDYPMLLMFDLVWNDPRSFSKVDSLTLRFDPVEGGMDQIGGNAFAIMGETDAIPFKDESTKSYHILLPYFVAQDMDANENLYDQDELQFSFKVIINYEYDGVADEQMQFVQAKVSLQSPYDFSKFLTPELVNDKLIPFFNESKEFVDDMSNFTRDTLIKNTMPVCIALMAANTAVSFFSATDGGETAKFITQAMKAVCDRIFSPQVPPKGPTNSDGDPINIDTNELMGNLNAASATAESIETTQGYKTWQALNQKVGGSEAAGSSIPLDSFLGSYGEGVTIGYYREGNIFNINNVPCNPVITGVDSSITSTGVGALVTSAAQSGEYITGITPGLTQANRCFYKDAPYYDNWKCIPGVWITGPANYDLNPMHDLLDSIRCGSFSGFYLQTQRVSRHLTQLLDCLESIEEGVLDAGYCEHFLTTSACEMFTWAFEKVVLWAQNEKIFSFKDTKGHTSFAEMTNSYEDALTRVAMSETGTTNYVHAMCLAAFGADASNFDTFLDSFLAAQDRKPTIGPIAATSHVNGYDDQTGYMQIQYKITPYIMAGQGADVSATIYLLCDGGKYCPNGGFEPYAVRTINVPRGTTFSETIYYNDNPAHRWYNKVYVDYSYDDVVLEPQSSYEYKCSVTEAEDCTKLGGVLVAPPTGQCTGSGQVCQLYTYSETSTTKRETKSTKPGNDVGAIGDINFNCWFDVNSNLGLQCDLGELTSGSAQMELVSVDMFPKTYYKGTDLYALLDLKKWQYEKEDFIVRYVVRKSDGTLVKEGAETYLIKDVFKCNENDVLKNEVILPVPIIKQETTADVRTVFTGNADLREKMINSSYLLRLTSGESNFESTLLGFNEVILTSEDGVEHICYPQNFREDYFSFGNCLDTTKKIKNIQISAYSTSQNIDALSLVLYRLDETVHSSVNMNPSSSSDLTIGSYDFEFELYHCVEGSCPSGMPSLSPTDDRFEKILYGIDADGEDGEVKSFRVNNQDPSAKCKTSPEVKIINPVKNIKVSNSVERFMDIIIYDDCDKDFTGGKVTYQVGSKVNTDVSLNYNSKFGSYFINFKPSKVGLDVLSDYSNLDQFELVVKVKDDLGNVGSGKQTFVVTTDDDTSEMECRVSSGLSGSAVTPSLADQALDMI
ncbi:hypothetical protein C0585_07875 [Candidatus Woesearchaeota archaeon]|nr:MAG: hypothetical protein C0585_07875 [Candidatus Woesearchaeota archaeon]